MVQPPLRVPAGALPHTLSRRDWLSGSCLDEHLGRVGGCPAKLWGLMSPPWSLVRHTFQFIRMGPCQVATSLEGLACPHQGKTLLGENQAKSTFTSEVPGAWARAEQE